ncbi:sugar dehydrogenase [Leptospira hartskeerlii]|uniref:Sugar dehydrogenase n=1 Tax=Leptospira hartskeerlii TaxID=2023177 RepID=A0A2M9X9V0_9LEPT|nr:PQQ-dependent sugar dehydrogenase [Leptospira hartskeerlii]PJZ24471.1 sugar dehydrogenase [Leptospira hartskeerlii]PJZ32917.1 sugar dehydrogenase [Leptospira hartskeerlii]
MEPASKIQKICIYTIVSLSIFLAECSKPGGSRFPFLPILSGCSEDRNPPCLKLNEIASGLNSPLFLVSPSGDASRIFILEQGGKVSLIKDGSLLPSPFLDLGAEGLDLIAFSGERGLLGIAFHPNYNSNGRFWVNYTRKSDGDTVVAEYSRSSGDLDLANAASGSILFTVDQPFSNHNGGMMAFDTGGYLLVGMGDGGGAGDPNNEAQNLESSLGKILRIDIDNYPTPVPGNRPATGLENPHIWDWGVRNPWRFSLDRGTGDLYIADVGQNNFEELNIEPANTGMKNYGWRLTEGNHCYDPSFGCTISGISFPKLEYDHFIGSSITGGYVYRGSNFPALNGRYFYGDFIAKRIWSILWDGTEVTDPLEHTSEMGFSSNVSSFGEDANGEIYVVDYGGKIFRIETR